MVYIFLFLYSQSKQHVIGLINITCKHTRQNLRCVCAMDMKRCAIKPKSPFFAARAFAVIKSLLLPHPCTDRQPAEWLDLATVHDHKTLLQRISLQRSPPTASRRECERGSPSRPVELPGCNCTMHVMIAGISCAYGPGWEPPVLSPSIARTS